MQSTKLLRVMAGTLRFQALVDRSGRPDVYTPWSDPAKDPAFQKARKRNRVLTIHQNLRGAKDFGEIGFRQGPGLQFLIFPKSLSWAEGKRVIGIRYEDIAEARFPAKAAVLKSRKPREVAKSEPKKRETLAEPVESASEVRETEAEEPVKTEQLKSILRDLEKKHATKAKSALKNLIEARERERA